MGQVDSHRPETSQTPPPPWWTVDGADVPLESLETGPLPDGTRPGDIKKLQDLVRLLARENRLLRQRLEEELKHRYGSRSEKGKSGKGNGEGEGGSPAPGSDSPPGPDATGSSSATNTTASEDGEELPGEKTGHGRRPIPPDLPRDEVQVPLDEESCKRCHGPIHKLERVESYRYHYVPGHIRVRVLVRWRCVCNDPTCDAPFRIAKLPPEPIPKSRATAGFLAHLLVTKFADHCPLYRFRKILLRQKVDLPLSTLVDYCKKSTDLLKPLWELMRKRIFQGAIIRTDDTHVKVRLVRKKGVLKGHLWAYKGDDAHPYVVFVFTPNWEGKGPQTFLEEFEGYIQADGYKGYDKLFKNPRRIEVGCMAHARRKWFKAKTSSPKEARQALDLIRQLYAIEDACEKLSPDERKRIRQERSGPILEKLRVLIEEQRRGALPKSPLAAATEYAWNQWAALTRFLEDGRLKIDNNDVERELRNVALGRKNWLAAGSEVGGETAAIGYTMIASAVACGVDPVEWLTDVLERIVTCTPDQLVDLLPDRWKAARGTQRPGSSEASVDRSPDAIIRPTDVSASSPPFEPATAAAENPGSEVVQSSGQRHDDQEEPARPPDPGSNRPPDDGGTSATSVPPLPQQEAAASGPAARPAGTSPAPPAVLASGVASEATATPASFRSLDHDGAARQRPRPAPAESRRKNSDRRHTVRDEIRKRVDGAHPP